MTEENYKRNQRRRDMVALAKIVSPVLTCIFLTFYFEHFVVSSILAHIEINGLIVGTILYGAFVVLQRFFNSKTDFSILEQFGREAVSGRPMNEIVEEPWIRQRYIRHYIKHVAALEAGGNNEASMHAIENELHALNDEYNSRLELPQFLVGFMIALGLLGTFIGLLETLTGISAMLEGLGGGGGDESIDQQFMKLVGELRKPLEGMGIAFAASMFGLVGSLVLSIMMINLRRYVARVIMCARNVMHDIVEIKKISYATEHSTGSGGSPHMMVLGNSSSERQEYYDYSEPSSKAPVAANADVRDALEEAGYSSSSALAADSTMMLVANRVDLLVNKLEPMIQTLETAAKGTNRLNELLGFGPRMKETSERTYEELKNINEQETAQLQLLRQVLEVQAAAVNGINGLLETQRQSHDEQSRQDAAQQQLLRQVLEVQTSTVNGINSLLEAQRQSYNDNGRRLTAMVDKLSAIDESGIATGRHLWEVRESFAKMAAAMSVQEMMAASMGQQSMLLEALLNESRQTRQWMAQFISRNSQQNS